MIAQPPASRSTTLVAKFRCRRLGSAAPWPSSCEATTCTSLGRKSQEVRADHGRVAKRRQAEERDDTHGHTNRRFAASEFRRNDVAGLTHEVSDIAKWRTAAKVLWPQSWHLGRAERDGSGPLSCMPWEGTRSTSRRACTPLAAPVRYRSTAVMRSMTYITVPRVPLLARKQ